MKQKHRSTRLDELRFFHSWNMYSLLTGRLREAVKAREGEATESWAPSVLLLVTIEPLHTPCDSASSSLAKPEPEVSLMPQSACSPLLQWISTHLSRAFEYHFAKSYPTSVTCLRLRYRLSSSSGQLCGSLVDRRYGDTACQCMDSSVDHRSLFATMVQWHGGSKAQG